MEMMILLKQPPSKLLKSILKKDQKMVQNIDTLTHKKVITSAIKALKTPNAIA